MKIHKIILFIAILIAEPCVASFKDIAKDSGINFIHFNGMSGKFYFHEMMGGGVALFDYDNDGDIDVFLNQGAMIGDTKKKDLIFNPAGAYPLKDRLYRNDSKNGLIKFTDVTSESKINATGYGMGVSYADIDNDGDLDIYILNYGRNEMWQNNGDGTFSDITNTSGTGDTSWSSSASFFDFDKDGYLDLYVVNYVDYKIDNFLRCKSYDGSLDYCSPQGYKAKHDKLYHNNKDGTFTDVSSRTGILTEMAPGLGVVAADFNNDGWVDLYVANDGEANILWINNKNNTFVNVALTSGVAVNMTGMAEASMGVDAADFDNDGDMDLFMTHLNRQTNTLYVNNGKGWFSDAGIRMGVASSSFQSTGFGTAWVDFNNDGLLDLFSANGAVIKELAQMKQGSKYPLKQINQIWVNKGKNKYKEITKLQDKTFLKPGVSRGLAYGDLDNDGDLDMIVTNNADSPQVLINSGNNLNNWIGLKLIRNDLNREDYSAKVEVTLGKSKIYRQLKTDGSYASAHDSRILVGLGKISVAPEIKIIWTDGKVQKLKELILNKYNTIKRN